MSACESSCTATDTVPIQAVSSADAAHEILNSNLGTAINPQRKKEDVVKHILSTVEFERLRGSTELAENGLELADRKMTNKRINSLPSGYYLRRRQNSLGDCSRVLIPKQMKRISTAEPSSQSWIFQGHLHTIIFSRLKNKPQEKYLFWLVNDFKLLYHPSYGQYMSGARPSGSVLISEITELRKLTSTETQGLCKSSSTCYMVRTSSEYFYVFANRDCDLYSFLYALIHSKGSYMHQLYSNAQPLSLAYFIDPGVTHSLGSLLSSTTVKEDSQNGDRSPVLSLREDNDSAFYSDVTKSLQNVVLKTADDLHATKRNNANKGSLFLHKYHVVRHIAYGGYSFLKLLFQRKEGRFCVGKFMNRQKVRTWTDRTEMAEKTSSDVDMPMIPMEISILASLEHPKIVSVLDVFISEDYYIMIMPYFSGSASKFNLKTTRFSKGICFCEDDNESLAATANDTTTKEHTDKPCLDNFVREINAEETFRGLTLAYDEMHLVSRASALELPFVPSSGTAETSKEICYRLPPVCDLFEYIEKTGPLTEACCQFIFMQLTETVHYLHDRSFVHGDLKDENILVDAHSLTIQLIDFGSSFRSFPNELTKVFYGSRKCAAPEVLRGEEYVGFAQDMWSLGIILYNMLYAEDPFLREEEMLYGQWSFSNKVVISENARDVIVKLLKPYWKDRMTMSELLQHPFLVSVAS